MVLVKVRLRLFDSIMEGHLNLSNHKGRWMICAKHFHRVGNAVQSTATGASAPARSMRACCRLLRPARPEVECISKGKARQPYVLASRSA
jgi:hypothetical protein